MVGGVGVEGGGGGEELVGGVVVSGEGGGGEGGLVGVGVEVLLDAGGEDGVGAGFDEYAVVLFDEVVDGVVELDGVAEVAVPVLGGECGGVGDVLLFEGGVVGGVGLGGFDVGEEGGDLVFDLFDVGGV